MKKIISILLCAVMALSMSACTMRAPASVMTVEGEEIPAGLYLLYQMQAYSAAGTKAEDPKAELLKSEIEGIPAEEWIHNETVEAIRRFVWTEKAFAEKELSFSEEEQQLISTQLENVWQFSKENLEKNGIGRESYRVFFENGVKQERLLYLAAEEEGSKISDDDAKKYMDEKYSRIGMVILPVTDDNGEPLEESVMKKMNGEAEKLAEALNDGADFDKAAEETLKAAYSLAGREYSEDVLKMLRTKGFVQEGSAEYPEEIVKNVLESETGAADVYYSEKVPMVYQHIANYADNDDFTENYRAAIISEITGKELEDRMNAETEAYTVKENASAVRVYSPSKIEIAD